MMRIPPNLLSVLLLSILLPLHAVNLGKAADDWNNLPKAEGPGGSLPSEVLKLTSLEFDGLSSDFLFLRAMTFFGSTFERTARPRVKDWEWQMLYHDIDTATELDPYFFDPYFFAQSNLTWEGEMVPETNQLLEKGSRFRDWDWTLPFYLGFNHFYFLKDNDKASGYLMEASKRPGATPLIASLATRLAVKEKRTENAIIFLQQMVEKEMDETIKEEYQTRLIALKGIYFLEQAIEDFEKLGEGPPLKLSELVDAGLIVEIPEDPYGGTYYVDAEGSVGTTSNLRPID